jgi:ketosteroid isomerase-like protein
MRETSREESQMPTSKKSFDPETFVREAYATAERMDLKGWKSLFAHDGIFTDQSVGVTYRGPDLDYPVRQYGTAFGDMHGTHTGPLATPFGTLPPTGNRMDAPCADIFELADRKIKRFDCYPEGSVLLTQLGVIGNLEAALKH